MLTRQTQVRISPEFPQRDRSEPILHGQGSNPQSEGSAKLEVEPQVMEENVGVRRQGHKIGSHQTAFPMPKMEIPLFDDQNPRWWARRCARVFSLHNVAETQKVTLVAAYLNDEGDTGYHGWSGVKEECTRGNLWKDYVSDLVRRECWMWLKSSTS